MKSPLSLTASLTGFFKKPSISRLAKLEAAMAELDSQRAALMAEHEEVSEALRKDIQFEQITPDKSFTPIHQQLFDNEAVHKVDSVEEMIEMRIGDIGANKRCFARVIENGKPEVTAGIFTALVKVPNIDGRVNYDSIPGDIDAIKAMDVEEFVPPEEGEDVTVVAILYTISGSKHNLEKSGRLLASDVYEFLHSEAKAKEYDLLVSTLSPTRSPKSQLFANWLSGQAGFEDLFDDNGMPSEEFMGFIQSDENQDAVRHMLMRYLLEEKDPVMNFHLGNGAYIGDLKFNPENERDWAMVNYVYASDPETVAANQELYSSSKIRPIAPHLKAHLRGTPELVRQVDYVFDTDHTFVPAPPQITAETEPLPEN